MLCALQDAFTDVLNLSTLTTIEKALLESRYSKLPFGVGARNAGGCPLGREIRPPELSNRLEHSSIWRKVQQRRSQQRLFDEAERHYLMFMTVLCNWDECNGTDVSQRYEQHRDEPRRSAIAASCHASSRQHRGLRRNFS